LSNCDCSHNSHRVQWPSHWETMVQWRSHWGDWRGTSPPPPLSFRTTFEICLKPLRNCGVTLIRFHVQLIIRNLITEDAGILDRIMMLYSEFCKISPQNGVSEALNFKIFRRSMPADPLQGLRLWRTTCPPPHFVNPGYATARVKIAPCSGKRWHIALVISSKRVRS
jgi:hypothetical protein